MLPVRRGALCRQVLHSEEQKERRNSFRVPQRSGLRARVQSVQPHCTQPAGPASLSACCSPPSEAPLSRQPVARGPAARVRGSREWRGSQSGLTTALNAPCWHRHAPPDWRAAGGRAGGVCSMHSPLAVVVPAALLAACCAAGARRLRSSGPEARAGGPRSDTSCAIGIYGAENARNASMLLRSAFLLGADAVFTVCKKFKQKKSSWGPGDTLGASGQLNTMHCTDIDDMIASLPADAAIVGVEKGGVPLRSFAHPLRAIYLLGAENAGLPPEVLARCQHVVELETVRGSCGGEGASHTHARTRARARAHTHTHTLSLPPSLLLSASVARLLTLSLARRTRQTLRVCSTSMWQAA